MPDPLLSVAHVSVDYQSRSRSPWPRRISASQRVLRDVSLDVPRGGAYGVVGESGAGKTTLLRVIAGLTPPASGSLTYAGAPLPARRSRAQRRAIQVVFQDPHSSLNPRLTIEQVLGELLRVHQIVPAAAIRAECERLLDMVGLPASALSKRPTAFSGGQRQRIGIARALSLRPQLLLADEPVSALDVSIQASILQLLRNLQLDLELTILFLSHDLAVVRQFCDRVAVLHHGAIVEEGPPSSLLSSPRHPYTRELVAAS